MTDSDKWNKIFKERRNYSPTGIVQISKFEQDEIVKDMKGNVCNCTVLEKGGYSKLELDMNECLDCKKSIKV